MGGKCLFQLLISAPSSEDSFGYSQEKRPGLRKLGPGLTRAPAQEKSFRSAQTSVSYLKTFRLLFSGQLWPLWTTCPIQQAESSSLLWACLLAPSLRHNSGSWGMQKKIPNKKTPNPCVLSGFAFLQRQVRLCVVSAQRWAVVVSPPSHRAGV